MHQRKFFLILLSILLIIVFFSLFTPVLLTYTRVYKLSIDCNKPLTMTSLDVLGNRHVYDEDYRNTIQYIEWSTYPIIKKMSTTGNVPIQTKRIIRIPFQIIKTEKDNPIVVIEKKAWPIKKCIKRVTSNFHDGDARFVLGGYYLLQNNFKKALEMYQVPEYASFTHFRIDQMYEYLGYVYYKLGLREKNKKRKNDYLSLLKKEQFAYASAIDNATVAVQKVYYSYIYALTYVDHGLYIERSQLKTSIAISKRQPLTQPKEIFEKAINILLRIDNPSVKIYELLAQLYDKINQPEKARVHRENKKAVYKKNSIQKKQQQVFNKIFQGLDIEKLIDQKFKTWYMNELIVGYKQNKTNNPINFDSLVSTKCMTVAEELLRVHPEYNIDNSTSIAIKHIIQEFLNKKVHNLLVEQTKVYVNTEMKIAFDTKNYFHVIYLYKNSKNIRQSQNDAKEIEQMVAISQRELNEKQQKWKKIPEKQSKKQSTYRSNYRSKTRLDTMTTSAEVPPTIDKLGTQTEGLETTLDSNKVENETVSTHKKIGLLIDDLVEKKDYIGAYRGLKAYEKLLKENFSVGEIDRAIANLEKIIENSYGKVQLFNLKKELQH